jgi:hypothetical protein
MFLRPCIVLAALALLPSAAIAQVNVALDRPVSLVAGSANGAALSTITDGVFRPRGQQWQSGTVWWSGLASTFEIDLGGIYLLDSAIAQCDDNDTYALLYRNLDTGEFLPLWSIPVYGGGGMQTRPNAADNTQRYVFPNGPVSTDAIRIAATGGDNSYSLSEVQVFVVPTPGSLALLALGGMICVPRRRH